MTSDKVVSHITGAEGSWEHVHLGWCWILLLAVPFATAYACTTNAVFTDCPPAMDAAQFLTSNNSMLPISNANWSYLPCGPNASDKYPYISITSFGCHYLASMMPQGALVLSNGNARVAANVTNNGANSSISLTGVSDDDLYIEASKKYSNPSLKDAVSLVFDIKPTASGPLFFQYVFGSEEYPYFAPRPGKATEPYNDVFAFIVWPVSSSTKTNIALLPGSAEPVSIGTVNQLYNTYYIANHPPNSPHATALNGMTKLLNTTTYNIVAGTTYRIKLVIADMLDQKYDSLVWVKAGSLTFASPPIVPCMGNYTAWSPCSQACGGGTQSRIYLITRPAANGGAACTAANGTVETQSCNNAPCQVNCVAGYSSWTSCSETCGGGSQNRTYIITVAAANGGTPCAAANGTVFTQSCNTAACPPVNCVGAYSSWTPCNATCGGGIESRTYTVNTAAAHGGTPCAAANGTVETRSCNTAACLPVDCVGAFSSWTSCNATCGGGSQSRTYPVTVAAANGGAPCPFAHGYVEVQYCNTDPCPVDCVGSYSAWSTCNETCGGGWQQQTYTVTTAAANNGTACPEPDGKVNMQQCNMQACGSPAPPGASPSPTSPQPSPADPSPSPADPSPSPADSSPSPADPSPSPADASSSPADASPSPADPSSLQVSPGSPESPNSPSPQPPSTSPPDPAAPPVSPGPSSPAAIPSPAGGVGSSSPDASSPPINQSSPLLPASPSPIASPPPTSATSPPPAAPSPVPPSPPTSAPQPSAPSTPDISVFDGVPYVNSPPVLPPPPPMDDSNITIRGGNVSITGVKVESVGASIGSGESSSSTPGQTVGSTPPQRNLTLRWAAFNGSLGFYTLGVNIEVYGEFTLHRTMNWTWDAAWKAWTTEVSIVGKFLLTKDEEMNGVVTSTQTLEPSVAGQLTLFSAVYPGPGFSGKYDWAGQLDMEPDPFAFWGIQTLTNINRLGAVSSPQRSLLQSSTGNTPVQGRVSVREVNSKAGLTINNPSQGAGSQVAIDEDIAAIVPPANSNYWTLFPPDDQVVTGKARQTFILVLAAIVAPSTVALCAVAVVGAVIYRQKKRKEQQQQQQAANKDKEAEGQDGATESETGASSSCEGATAASTRSRKNRKGSPSRGQAVGRDPSSPELELSNSGGDSTQLGSFTASQDGPTSLSHVEFLDVNEAGQSMSFTSYPNLRRPAGKHLPGMKEETEEGTLGKQQGASKAKRTGRFGSLTGSIAGMASSIAGAISNFRVSQSGQSYLYTGRDAHLPGMSSGAGGTRAAMESPASFNLLAPGQYLGAPSSIRSAATGGQTSGLQPASTSKAPKPMQQSVPAQWALPKLEPGAQTRNTTWATGVAASWASDIMAISRGSTPPAATADDGEPDNEPVQEVVTGGSTFMLPSRTRGFSPH